MHISIKARYRLLVASLAACALVLVSSGARWYLRPRQSPSSRVDVPPSNPIRGESASRGKPNSPLRGTDASIPTDDNSTPKGFDNTDVNFWKQCPHASLAHPNFDRESLPAIPQPRFKSPSPQPTAIQNPFPLLFQEPPPKRWVLRAPPPNKPSTPHVKHDTPLLIGWTPEELGWDVVLQFARDKEWDQFFWTHPDLLVLSNENEESVRSAYIKAVEILRELKNKKLRWANYFFECDRLVLTNVAALLSIGGWDAAIPSALAHCDVYARLAWAGYWQGSFPGTTPTGLFFEVDSTMYDLGALLRLPGAQARLAPPPERSSDGSDEDNEVYTSEYVEHVNAHGETFKRLVDIATRLQDRRRERESAQSETGEQNGFKRGEEILSDAGRAVFTEKWGHLAKMGCELWRAPIKGDDAWRLEKSGKEDERKDRVLV
ncbi:uncharacterized protein CTHT_0015570 [Thermochaetoides thermophila DSM 1495]|uniref:Uncharacterized protein n=1 Tax=Chaetomium thermophilum (strain DSM 1495 / CBS 144.50 / IMI 039719) TaxID=759272 RepID=G0S211_CHATD|nr:hypothetical protein CTHT_0015570 [Thermochaetoides thermophila DSM 1495]EGS23071.1 hypothetical protein CTHT_0015570 [Thermochaetoides thermophila DSM 1495]